MHSISDHQPPNCCALLRFLTEQAGTNPSPLHMEGRKITSEALCLLPQTAKGWAIDTLAEDTKICVKFEVPLVLHITYVCVSIFSPALHDFTIGVGL